MGEATAPIVAALTALAEHGIPPDTQELLLRGDALRSIPPGALTAAINAALAQSERRLREALEAQLACTERLARRLEFSDLTIADFTSQARAALCDSTPKEPTP